MPQDRVEYDRRYREKHPERIKAAGRKYMRRIREEHPERVRAAKQKIIGRNKEYVAEYLAEHPCIACGATEGLCFHHSEPETKRLSVGDLTIRGHSLEVIWGEIDKCVVLCRSCHMKHHRNEEKRCLSRKKL